jgi:maleamate amidohydrolase
MPALGKLMINDPEAIEIDPRIAPGNDDIVFNKRAPSAFFETGFVSMLVPMRVDTLIVTGCATSGCIRATVIDALSYGYRVAIPSDCIADRAEGPHEANLFDMDSKYGDVTSGDAVIEYFKSLPSTVPRAP